MNNLNSILKKVRRLAMYDFEELEAKYFAMEISKQEDVTKLVVDSIGTTKYSDLKKLRDLIETSKVVVLEQSILEKLNAEIDRLLNRMCQE